MSRSSTNASVVFTLCLVVYSGLSHASQTTEIRLDESFGERPLAVSAHIGNWLSYGDEMLFSTDFGIYRVPKDDFWSPGLLSRDVEGFCYEVRGDWCFVRNAFRESYYRYYKVSLTGGEAICYYTGAPGEYVDVSPDGEWGIIFTPTSAGRLLSVRTDGTGSPICLSDTSFRHSAPVFTADGTRLVFVRSLYQRSTREVCSVSVDGSAPPLVLSETPYPEDPVRLVLAPDGNTIIYGYSYVYGGSNGCGVYAVPADGTAPVRQLVPASERVASFYIAADTGKLVYRSTPDDGVSEQVYSVPLDGSSAPVNLSAPVTPDSPLEYDIVVTPDGSRVLFGAGNGYVYSALVDGSGDPIVLTEQNCTSQFACSPDGATAVYASLYCLYSVPVDGSAPAILLAEKGDGEARFRISKDSRRVVYVYHATLDDDETLKTVPLNGEAPPSSIVCSHYIGDFDLTDEGMVIASVSVWRDPLNIVREVVSGPVDGSEPALSIEPKLHLPREYYLSPEGRAVVYRAYHPLDSQKTPPEKKLTSLRSVFIDSLEPLDVGLTLPGRPGAVSLAGHGRYAVFPDWTDPSVCRLMRVPVDGSATPSEVDVVESYFASYKSDYVAYSVYEGPYSLLSVMQLDGEPAPTTVFTIDSSYFTYHLTPMHFATDGNSFLMKTELSSGGTYQCMYFNASMSGLYEPIELTTEPIEYRFDNQLSGELSPDDSKLIFRGSRDVSYWGYEFWKGLYWTSFDGSVAPVKVMDWPDTEVWTGYSVTPDSNWVLFGVLDQVEDASGMYQLYSAPLTTEPEPVLLAEDVFTALPSQDSSTVVYQSRDGLYGIPVGGGGAVGIADGVPEGQFKTIENGLVLYVARVGEADSLFAASVDGSAVPVKLSGDLDIELPNPFTDTGLPFRVSEDQQQVSFCARDLMDPRLVIRAYSVPVTGGEVLLRSGEGIEPDGPGGWLNDVLVYSDISPGESGGGIYASVLTPYSVVPEQVFESTRTLDGWSVESAVYTITNMSGLAVPYSLSVSGAGVGLKLVPDEEPQSTLKGTLEVGAPIEVIVCLTPEANLLTAGTHEYAVSIEVAGGQSQVNAILTVNVVLVPDVVGMTQSQAELTIAAVQLTVSGITEAYSDTVPTGNVISQAPAADAVVAFGSGVTLVVSSGPQLALVPDVVGMTRSEAQGAIADAGLVIGSIRRQRTSSTPAGNVISQQPGAGAAVTPGSPVDLTIARESLRIALGRIVLGTASTGLLFWLFSRIFASIR